MAVDSPNLAIEKVYSIMKLVDELRMASMGEGIRKGQGGVSMLTEPSDAVLEAKKKADDLENEIMESLRSLQDFIMSFRDKHQDQ